MFKPPISMKKDKRRTPSGADPGFSEGPWGKVASTASVARHNLSACTPAHDLSQPPQVMHKARKLLSCIEKCHMKAFVVSHCCKKFAISDICLAVE
jgi:hypothetical protein